MLSKVESKPSEIYEACSHINEPKMLRYIKKTLYLNITEKARYHAGTNKVQIVLLCPSEKR
jgi:hypothetical protein